MTATSLEAVEGITEAKIEREIPRRPLVKKEEMPHA